MAVKSNIEWKVLIAMIPCDDMMTEEDGYNPNAQYFGVRLQVERHNWTSGVNTRYRTPGVWGFEEDALMMEVLRTAQDEFEILKQEYPGLFDNVIVDEATPARFI